MASSWLYNTKELPPILAPLVSFFDTLGINDVFHSNESPTNFLIAPNRAEDNNTIEFNPVENSSLALSSVNL